MAPYEFWEKLSTVENDLMVLLETAIERRQSAEAGTVEKATFRKVAERLNTALSEIHKVNIECKNF